MKNIEDMLDGLVASHRELRGDMKELKRDLKPVFEHVSNVRVIVKAVSYGTTLGGFVFLILKFFIYHA